VSPRDYLILGAIVGATTVGPPAYWWAVLRRAHSDYQKAKKALPGMRKTRDGATVAFLKWVALPIALVTLAAAMAR
jgi:hypothetical protein